MLQDLFAKYPDVEKAVKKICGAISSIGRKVPAQHKPREVLGKKRAKSVESK